ncbi:hypothetical protein AB9E00_26930, partial [Klebsiella pneumoniae]
MPAFEWVHVQLHQQKGMISLSPPTICNSAARRDYEQRRARQRQGIDKAKSNGKFKGRTPDLKRYEAINKMLASGNSWTTIQQTLNCSRSTIAKAVNYKLTKESTNKIRGD